MTRIALSLVVLIPTLSFAQTLSTEGVAGAVPPVSRERPLSETGRTVASPEGKASGLKSGAKARMPPRPSLPEPSDVTKNLYLAVSNRNFDLAETLLSQGGDINCRNCDNYGRLLLSKAVLAARPTAIQEIDWLLSRGANINGQDQDGKTPLMNALDPALDHSTLYTLRVPLAMSLLERGAKASIKDGRGVNALQAFAVEQIPALDDVTYGTAREKEYNAKTFRTYQQVVKALLANGVDINEATGDGYSPLVITANDCNPDVVALYLSLGADPRQKTSKGETALTIATSRAVQTASRFCNEVVSLLSGAPADRSVAETRSKSSEKRASNSANAIHLQRDQLDVMDKVCRDGFKAHGNVLTGKAYSVTTVVQNLSAQNAYQQLVSKWSIDSDITVSDTSQSDLTISAFSRGSTADRTKYLLSVTNLDHGAQVSLSFKSAALVMSSEDQAKGGLCDMIVRPFE